MKQLVAAKQRSEANEQEALDKLTRQNNWDVSLSIGAHQQINPLLNNTSLYGAITVSYNLASRAINKHPDQAAASYTSWKNVQENDVANNAVILKSQVAAGISVQTDRLKALQEQHARNFTIHCLSKIAFLIGGKRTIIRFTCICNFSIRQGVHCHVADRADLRIP